MAAKSRKSITKKRTMKKSGVPRGFITVTASATDERTFAGRPDAVSLPLDAIQKKMGSAVKISKFSTKEVLQQRRTRAKNVGDSVNAIGTSSEIFDVRTQTSIGAAG